MLTITRKLEFDAAHRIHHHESKCATLHGHRYVAEITVSAQKLDTLGRIIDFSVIKKVMGDWIDENWDHNTILWSEDQVTVGLVSQCPGNKPPFVLASNPTVENLAKALFLQAESLLKQHQIAVKDIKLYETPNCWASFSRGSSDEE